MKTMW